MILQGSARFQKAFRYAEKFQNIPNDLKRFQKILKDFKKN